MRWTVSQLESMPTLLHGLFDDLKIKSETLMVWLSLVEPKRISVEFLWNGRWIVTEYED